MPNIEDCTKYEGRCVVIPFRDFCLNEDISESELPAIDGCLTIENLDGQPLTDENGAYAFNCPVIERYKVGDWTTCTINGCNYLALKTCGLPANIDSDHEATDPEWAGLIPANTFYNIDLTVGNKQIECRFQIDAAVDYDSVEECDGCVPIGALKIDGVPPVNMIDPFIEAVCSAIKSFDQAGVSADNAEFLLGCDADGNCVLYNAPDTPVITQTVKYVEGETIAYDVTLPDGTVLAAGSPVPAGTCIVSEENPDGSVAYYNVFVVSDENHTPQVFIAGDVVDIEITLEDGTVLAVGDTVPDGLCIFLELDTDGNIVEQDQLDKAPTGCQCNFTFSAYDPLVHIIGQAPPGDGSEANPFNFPIFPEDVDTLTVKYVEGDTIAYDVTLQDGTVITAGTPLPANVCVVAEENPDGTSAYYNSIVVTDENHTPEVYIAGDTVDHIIDLGNGTILNPGDVLPDGFCVFLELDTDGNVVETDVQNKVVDPCLFDPCAWTEEPVIPCEEVVNVLAADADGVCGPTPIIDLIPQSLPVVCDIAGLPVVTPQGVPGVVEHAFTSSLLGNGQLGEVVVNGGNQAYDQTVITAADFPLQLTVPAHTAGCVLFLHLAYGGFAGPPADFSQPGFDGVTATLTSGTDISAPVFIGEQSIPSASGTQFISEHQVYAMDGLTGAAGSVVDVNTLTLPPFNNGVFAWNWIEVCDSSDNQLNVTDFNIAGAQQTLTGSDNGVQPQVSDPWDLGACPAVVFAAGRHVASDPNDGTAVNTPFTPQPTDWFQAPAGVDELYDFNSINDFDECQMGWAAAFVDGNLGSWTFDKTSNATTQHGAGAIGISLNTCDGGAGGTGGTEVQDACTIDITNDDCVEGLLSCCVRASIQLTAEPGEVTTVHPTLNGAVDTSVTLQLDNSNGTTAASEEKSTYFCVTDFSAFIAPGATTQAVFGWEITNTAGTGSAQVVVHHSECKIG